MHPKREAERRAQTDPESWVVEGKRASVVPGLENTDLPVVLPSSGLRSFRGAVNLPGRPHGIRTERFLV